MVSEYNIEAEQGVLGSVLIAPRTAAEVVGALSVEDWSPEHRCWFLGICSLFRAEKRLDAVTLLGELHEADDELNRQRRAYATQLIELTPTAANLPAYLDLMQRASRMRRYRRAAEAVLGAASEEDIPPLVEEMVSVAGGHRSADVLGLAAGWDAFLTRHETGAPTDFVTTGLRRLDSRVHIRPGKFVILGGYPSDGKTALALQMALHMARDHRVGFFSLETDHDDLMDRLAACHSGVSLSALLENRLQDEDWDKLVLSHTAIRELQLDLIHASGYTVDDIRARAKVGGYQVVMIDYTQIIRSTGKQSPYERVTAISMELHNMAQQMGVLVLALSQLTRPPKNKNGQIPPPSMSSLRESGQLEQDADAILLLTEHKDPKDERFRYTKTPAGAEFRQLLVAKNKTGPRRGSIPLWLFGEYQRFEEIRTVDLPESKPQPPQMEQMGFEELPDTEPLPF